MKSLELALQTLQQTDYAKAISLLQREVDNDPDCTEAWKGLAMAYCHIGEANHTMTIFQRLSTTYFSNEEAIFFITHLGKLLQQYYANKDDYIGQLNIPLVKGFMAHLYLAIACNAFINDHVNDALQHANKGLRLEPAHFQLLLLKANLLERLKLNREAFYCWNQLLNLPGKQSEVNYYISMATNSSMANQPRTTSYILKKLQKMEKTSEHQCLIEMLKITNKSLITLQQLSAPVRTSHLFSHPRKKGGSKNLPPSRLSVSWVPNTNSR